MDKETMTSYGWIAIVLMLMITLIMLATPFGDYIGKMSQNLQNSLKSVEENVDRNNAEKEMEDMFLSDKSNGKTLTKTPQPTEPGLYDENNELLASWHELINVYELDIESDHCVGAEFDFSEQGTMYYVLNNNQNLKDGTKLIVDNSVKKIGKSAFDNCRNITYIKLPNSIKTIGQLAFSSCIKLKEINIPNSVTHISHQAFWHCYELKNIYMPKSIETIWSSSYSSSIFYKCSSDLKIYCGALEKPSGWDNYWNYYDNDNQLSVEWNVTREQYQEITKQQ